MEIDMPHDTTQRSEFEREVLEYMATNSEHMKNQDILFKGFSKSIETLEDSVTSLNDSRTFAKGIIKAASIGVGAPAAIGSFAYCMIKFSKWFHGIK